MSLRTALILTMLGSFVVLGAIDIAAGNLRSGVAAVLLALANALLLT